MMEGLKELLRVSRPRWDTLFAGLVERDVAIRLALLAALAKEHLLRTLISPCTRGYGLCG